MLISASFPRGGAATAGNTRRVKALGAPCRPAKTRNRKLPERNRIEMAVTGSEGLPLLRENSRGRIVGLQSHSTTLARQLLAGESKAQGSQDPRAFFVCGRIFPWPRGTGNMEGLNMDATRLLRGNAFDHPTDQGSVAIICQSVKRSTRVDLANGCPVRALTKHTHDDLNTRNTCPASSGARDKESAAFSPRTGRFHTPYVPHFEPEPHAIGTGWSILLCAAAFGLGVMAAADGDDNQLLSPATSPPMQILRICADPHTSAAGEGYLSRILSAGSCANDSQSPRTAAPRLRHLARSAISRH